jgi:peptide/nickel transport system substrate-binding protein
VAAIRGERAMIQFRGFTPSQRDGLVQAALESPWNCSSQAAMNQEKQPFHDKRG